MIVYFTGTGNSRYCAQMLAAAMHFLWISFAAAAFWAAKTLMSLTVFTLPICPCVESPAKSSRLSEKKWTESTDRKCNFQWFCPPHFGRNPAGMKAWAAN